MNVFEKYFEHLATNPERIDNLTMWFVCTLFIWFWMVKYRASKRNGRVLFRDNLTFDIFNCMVNEENNSVKKNYHGYEH